MKKIMLILLIAVLAFCSACVNKDTLSASDIMARMVSGGVATQESSTYIDGADISSPNYISDQELGGLYYSQDGGLAELADVESYCIRIARSPEICEIHIFKMRYQSDTDKIERMLKRRSKLLVAPEINPNDSEFYTSKARECEVFSSGRFVFLVAGKDATSMVKAAKKAL